MLYLQLPKDGAREAGQRRPIALLPQVYRLWSAACKHDIKEWRQRCIGGKFRSARAPWTKALT
eukprot:4389240-Amphidinium_carterae.1